MSLESGLFRLLKCELNQIDPLDGVYNTGSTSPIPVYIFDLYGGLVSIVPSIKEASSFLLMQKASHYLYAGNTVPYIVFSV